jgi:sugar O-acyltransferase (sialic acid O-acetyltransferase NeuD family)
MNSLVIVGASGHGKVVADIAEKVGYTDIVFLDDNPKIESFGDYKVIGCSRDAVKRRGSDFIVAIGNHKVRRKIQSELLGLGLNVVTLIHPAAIVANHVKIGVGTVVMAGSVINPYTIIGDGCIVNTCASVDHDCYIGDYVHVSVGAHIAGTVTVQDNTWIGAGATVSNNINIVADCMIGAGSVVISDIVKSDTYIGVPAKRMIRD